MMVFSVKSSLCCDVNRSQYLGWFHVLVILFALWNLKTIPKGESDILIFMFCHDFRLPFDKLRAGHRKSRQNRSWVFLYLGLTPRVIICHPYGVLHNRAAVYRFAGKMSYLSIKTFSASKVWPCRMSVLAQLWRKFCSVILLLKFSCCFKNESISSLDGNFS